jgi:hypothetical protein
VTLDGRTVNGSAPVKVDGRLACKRCGRLWFARWPTMRGYERICSGCDRPTRDCTCEVVADAPAIPQQSDC